MRAMPQQGPVTLADAEASIKEVADWAGLTDLQKLRRASTETIFAMGTLYSSATGKRSVLTASPISPYIDGNMEPVITDFCLNREENGGKAWAYQFARPLPTDGRANVLQGAFHSSDLWFVFKSLKNCWRPWTQGDWDLSEKMLTAWSNFAKYSDPNGKDGGDWKPVTAAHARAIRRSSTVSQVTVWRVIVYAFGFVS